MYYYFLLRKIIFSLLVLAGIGVVILLARFYWGGPEEQPVSRLPVRPPSSQEKLALPPPEAQREQPLAKAEAESKSSLMAKDSERPALIVPGGVPETKTNVPSPAIEKNPAATAPIPEGKLSTGPPLKEVNKETLPKEIKKEPPPKEVKKETAPKESKKETKIKEGALKTKPSPTNSDKSESGNNQKGNYKTVAVKAGDSIYTIAEETYRVSNTSVVDRIMELNPIITDPDLLPANQKIKLPEITEESLILPSSEASVIVRLGTFAKPEYANFLKGLPMLQGKEIRVTPRKTPSGRTLYRVTAGKFDNREEGLAMIRELREKGLSPYFEGFKKKN
jgi:hypothetical protein